MHLLPLLFAAVVSVASVSQPVVSQPVGSQSAMTPAQTGSARDALKKAERATEHASPDWQLIAPHLADPATSSAAQLEMQGDLLRVRRFPEDAIEYYNHALDRGGDPAALWNKLGVTELEIGNAVVARAYFTQVVKLRPNDSLAWNNLGAVEFMHANYGTALRDYKRAVKYNRRSAVFHSNMGLAYVEMKNYESAKSEMMAALKIDPEVFQHSGSSGVSLHLLSTSDHATFCLEMAKVYARMGNEDEMIHQLETAAQGGVDVKYEMSKDADLGRFQKDPRVLNVILVAKSLKRSRDQNVIAAALPPAGP